MQKDDMSSSSCRASKRPRHSTNNGGDESPFDLLTLYQSDFGDRILSYASGQDLCTLDILNKKFKTLTTNQWNIVTKDRFGMNNGKEGWKVGTSFLRRPIFVHDAGGYDEPDNGSPHVAANESIVVCISDMAFNDEIEIRDASNLVNIRSVSTPINNWKVSICGRVGSEVIVTSNNEKICALWGNFAQQIQFDTRSGYGIETIGCDTHLIVAHDGRIHLYGVEQGDNNNNTEPLSLRKDIRVEEGAADEDGPAGDYDLMDKKLAWSPDKTHFAAGYSHQICVWKLDATNDEITLIKTIDVPNWEVTNVALAEDYIVASSKDKKVHIWNRSTGDKMVYGLQGGTTRDALCDVGVYDELPHDEEFVWPLFLSCHGSILVSTSHIGCAICIWDMKTGKLLKRHNEADEQGVVQMLNFTLTTGIEDVTDMAYLKRMNAFLCMGEYENMWVFPTNQVQSESAISLRNRVDAARLERENVSDSENESESNW